MRAWKFVGLGLAGLIVAAAAGGVIENWPTEAPTTSKLTVSQMMRLEEELNSRCRGGSGDDPKTMTACDQRDRLLEQLKDAGTCWGNPHDPNQAGYEKTWQPCGQGNTENAKSPNPTDASALYRLAHPDANKQDAEGAKEGVVAGSPRDIPSSEIQYDPENAHKVALINGAMSATRGCLRAQTINMVRIGYKDRETVAQGITNICQVILVRTNLMTSDEVAAMVKVMAYDAIKDVERENWGG